MRMARGMNFDINRTCNVVPLRLPVSCLTMLDLLFGPHRKDDGGSVFHQIIGEDS